MKNIFILLLFVFLVNLPSMAKGNDANMNYEYRKFENNYVIRLNKNAEVIPVIKEICEKNNIKLGTVEGIGAIKSATFGFFNPETKQYQEKTFVVPMEITSLLGNITTKNGETYLHIHMNAAGSDYKTIGGHLVNATISLTGEIIIKEIKGSVERKFSDEVGLNLFKFQK